MSRAILISEDKLCRTYLVTCQSISMTNDCSGTNFSGKSGMADQGGQTKLTGTPIRRQVYPADRLVKRNQRGLLVMTQEQEDMIGRWGKSQVKGERRATVYSTSNRVPSRILRNGLFTLTIDI